MTITAWALYVVSLSWIFQSVFRTRNKFMITKLNPSTKE